MMNNYPIFVLKNLDVRTRSGMEWQCLCPYHEDSSPSFSINVRKGLFVCYACGAKGTIKDLAKYLKVKEPREPIETIDDVEAKIRELTSGSGKSISKRVDGSFWTERYRIGDDWVDEWSTRLPDFVKDSRLTDMFCIGYDQLKNELIIPIFGFNGSADACVRRRLGEFDGPKYLYTKGFKTSHHVFGAWQVKSSINKRPDRVAIVEGSIDALSMWEVGIPAVAILGSNLSKTQKKILCALDAKEYLLLTDNDAAGRKARWQIIEEMKSGNSLIKVPEYWTNGAKDVAEMSRNERLKVASSCGDTWMSQESINKKITK